jgi:hypothetical protein
MEAVANVAKAGPKLGLNQAMISGRVTHLSTFEIKGKRMHEAVITTPAADAYSMPGVVAVQSTYKLGGVGDDVHVPVSVTGIPNSWTDRNSGEVKNSANVRLVAVE